MISSDLNFIFRWHAINVSENRSICRYSLMFKRIVNSLDNNFVCEELFSNTIVKREYYTKERTVKIVDIT